MNDFPERKCQVYDEEAPEPFCRNKAIYIASLDDGEPGEDGVLSTYCCEAHKDFNGHRKLILFTEWYAVKILGASEQQTDWDLV